MRNKDIIWKIGEEAAKKYLEDKGYEIIDQNYSTKYSEIDLIVRKLAPLGRGLASPGGDNVLIFVEVRTKRSSAFVSPEESIDYKKLKKLYWNAENYVGIKKYKGQYRIDAICIILDSDNNVEKLEHYKGI